VQTAYFVAPHRTRTAAAALVSARRRIPVLAGAILALTASAAAIVHVTSGAAGDTARPAAATATTAAAAAAAASPAPPAAAAAPTSGPGYRILSTDGGVFTHGWVSFEGSATGETASPSVGIAHPAGFEAHSYWVASADGGVFAFGDAPFLGSAAGASTRPIVDIASTATGKGYWLVAADGGVFGFGDAEYFGSGPEIGMASNKAVSIASTATGDGYWIVTSDGGVFAFGNAPFFGSLGDQQINARIIDLVPTRSRNGYYLVAADGGVFTFGDAIFQGAAIGEKLSKPIVDMALAPNGDGYWLLSGDGGVFSYGDAPFFGAPVLQGGRFTAIAAAIGFDAPAPVAEAASVEATVSAAAATPPVAAEPTSQPAATPEPAAAVKTSGNGKGAAKKAAEPALDGKFGWDISYPQCGGNFPGGDFHYAIVGVNGGRAFKYNKCLAEQWSWAKSTGAAGIYVNVHFPRSPEELAKGATSDRQPDCAPGALACVAYNFGLSGVRDSLAYATSQGVDAPFVWLDVEQLNYWYPEPAFNAVVLRGAVDAAAEAGIGVGVYSTPYQYGRITGNEPLNVPVWSAGADGLGSVAKYCAERGFGGHPATLVQLLPGQYDPNLACPGAGPMSRYFRMR
jgi:hypothetical protein